MIKDTPKLSLSNLSRATAIYVVDCSQFGPSWIFGLKMELMACADLVGGTMDILILNVIINDMKHFQTVSITTRRCHSHLCCWLLLIWPFLGVRAENWGYGICGLGWRYNRENLYFSRPYMLLLMIWNISELPASHLSRSRAIFVVDCCQFGPFWIFGLNMELMACADLVGGITEQSCLVLSLTC